MFRSAASSETPGQHSVRSGLASRQTLKPALRGVEAVYLMWPGLAVEPGVVDAIAEHATRVVYLSTNVADLPDGEQATSFHQENERLIRRSGVSWTFLRAIGFATNTLAWADQVRQGVMRLPFGQASRSLIHERDVVDIAVPVLTTDGHDGAKYMLTGPESITHAELVWIVGEAIGEEVRWQDLPPETAREQLIAAWGNAAFVDARLNAWRTSVDSPGRITDTVERLVGRPARTFRSWAEEHPDDFR